MEFRGGYCSAEAVTNASHKLKLLENAVFSHSETLLTLRQAGELPGGRFAFVGEFDPRGSRR
jgi:hypothetical protein